MTPDVRTSLDKDALRAPFGAIQAPAGCLTSTCRVLMSTAKEPSYRAVVTPPAASDPTAPDARTSPVSSSPFIVRGIYSREGGHASLPNALRSQFVDRVGTAEGRLLDAAKGPVLNIGTARLLAEFVLSHLDEIAFPLDVESIAEALGVQRLIHDGTIKGAGALEYRDSKVTIVYGNKEPALRRETIAHELGHFLLRIAAGIPFKKQLGDPGVEAFCDHFARQLLVPHGWLRALTPQGANVEIALEISEITGTSLATAATALLDAQTKRSGFLLIWQPRREQSRNWLVSHCISGESVNYRANASTVAALEAANGATRKVSFTIVRNGRVRDAIGDVVRVGPSVAMWIQKLEPVFGTPSNPGPYGPPSRPAIGCSTRSDASAKGRLEN